MKIESSKNIEIKNQQSKIKDGVNFIFEQNPELANSVFEILRHDTPVSFFEGDTIDLDGKVLNIVEKISSKDLAKRLGLEISSNTPVYIVKEKLDIRKGAFDTSQNIILLSENSDKETIHHELIHSVEYYLDKKELQPLYEKVKNTINEDSFNGFFSFNFNKNISEFVADAVSKTVFRNALKKEGLLDEVDRELSIFFKKVNQEQKQKAQEEYSEYLDTIFPESKVKDDNKSVIMYHNTENKFDISLYDKTRNMYWTSSLEGHFRPNENTISAILEIKNPKYVDAYEITNKAEKERTNEYKNNDGLIAGNEVYIERIKEEDKNPADYKQDLLFPEVVTFNPEQIHILGSEKDLENFKKFVESKKQNQEEKYLV